MRDLSDNIIIDELERLIDRAKYYNEPVTLQAVVTLLDDVRAHFSTLESQIDEWKGDANQAGFNKGKERMFDIITNLAEELDPEAKDANLTAIIGTAKEAL